MHHSMVKLPEKPMMPRLFDERVGYFTQGMTDYGAGRAPVAPSGASSRAIGWRRRIPNAAISEPVKPIVYYVDPATPKKWVPYIKKGDRGLAAGVRGGRLQERDRREGSAEPATIRTGAPKTRATR